MTECLLLAALLHLLLVLMIGNAPGGSARPGSGVAGSLNVTLRGYDRPRADDRWPTPAAPAPTTTARLREDAAPRRADGPSVRAPRVEPVASPAVAEPALAPATAPPEPPSLAPATLRAIAPEPRVPEAVLPALPPPVPSPAPIESAPLPVPPPIVEAPAPQPPPTATPPAATLAAPPDVVARSWTAQLRLHRKYARLAARGKPKQHVVTAVARELTGFVWAALTQ